ncbi:SpoIIE family protein phosphatase [Streptomyces sp. NRRL F-2664]|uniref:SpoIIE family protein phosphatase n=1 Tax=Streptomyces sp. NRRL F-2664 TaxID=1463842 RepID=UPI0004C72888|nr:SpoIIE family protein phosphatase [Streptomyces sp. NRRL F-2664]
MYDEMPFEELISSAAQNAGGRLGSLPLAQMATGSDGSIVRWNLAAQELLGYTAPEVVGRHIADLLHPAADPGLGRSLWETAATGRGVVGTVTAWHRDGHPIELEIWAGPVPDRREGASAVQVFAADAHATRRIRGSSAIWDGLFARSPVGIAIMDTQLRFLQVNAALEAMNGLSEAAHLGRRLAEVLPEVNAPEMEDAMRRALERGEAVRDRIRTGRTPADPYHDHVWSCSYVRLEDPAGRSVGVIASVVDITEQDRARTEVEAARRRLALLSQASARIGASLDLERTAQELADLAVPYLADTVTVDVLDALARGDEPGAGLAGGVDLRRLGKAPLTGSAVSNLLAPLGRTLAFPPAAPYTHPLVARQSHLITRLEERIGLGARYSPKPAQLHAAGVRSLMMVPLIARELVIGVATFYRTRTAEPYGRDDLTLAGELCARAAVSIDNARLYRHEHDTAVILQRSMLPQHITPPPDMETAHRYLPASDLNEVGGDWYDVLQLPGGKAALLMGDVMGHGIAAAAVMGRLSASVRALARLDMSPIALLRQLEATLADLAEPMLATFLYLVCDPATGHCTVTRAGHPPPVAAEPGGNAYVVDTPAGVPLGVGGIDFTTTDITLPRGSVLALYTDGLIETRSRDIDDRLNELTRLLSHPRGSLSHLCDSLITHLVPTSADDDIALLLARIGFTGT